MFFGIYWVFQIVVRGSWAAVNPSPDWEILLGGDFLLGEGNLRRSDFDNSNLFQSKKQLSVNRPTEHQLNPA